MGVSNKPKVLVVVGPTASGKSALAVKLAQKFDGEVISADSRQVYRGMDIGTGKITAEEMVGVPHHLLDVADPRRQFSVAQYQKLAFKKIEEILKRGKLPIICGGTGFYIQAVVDGLVLPEVKPNKKLRQQLSKLSTHELFARIRKLDPRRAKEIDSHNPHRLIRAIEIASALGRVPKIKAAPPPYDFLQIGIEVPATKLRQKIHVRLFARIRNGMIREVAQLHRRGVSWKRLESFGLEYQHVAKWLRTVKQDVKQLELAIWHYAKRQLTWFSRDKRIKWVKNFSEAQKLVRTFLQPTPSN